LEFVLKRAAEEALPPNREIKSPYMIVAEREEEQQRKSILQSALKKLSYRQRQIILVYFGLWGQQPQTLKELGRCFRITKERVRQVEARGLARLRVLLKAKGMTREQVA